MAETLVLLSPPQFLTRRCKDGMLEIHDVLPWATDRYKAVDIKKTANNLNTINSDTPHGCVTLRSLQTCTISYRSSKMRRYLAITTLLGLSTPLVDGLVPTRRQSSSSFAGSNEYFLHALPVSEQKTYIETLAARGAKVLRLWGE